MAIKERWLDTPFASISTHLFGASGTVHPLEANDVWYILDYDQRFHQEMMTVEGKCLHGACTTHWAFLDHEQYLI